MKRGTAVEVRFREKLAKRNKWTYLTCFEVLWAFGNAHATFQKKLLNNEHVVPNVVLWAKLIATRRRGKTHGGCAGKTCQCRCWQDWRMIFYLKL